MSNYLHTEITEKILKAFYRVYNTLGFGFLEKVYSRSLMIELRKEGLEVVKEHPIDVYYDDYKVGQYFADLIVENKVIVEIKAAEGLCPEHDAQLINYLKATDIEVGLLLNFGKTPEKRRKVLSASYKNHNKS
ncbi:MAG: GxxExxY protein [Bacteroidetes bacterium]|nr:GxxExxY protein [Bacteroidota bacterium]